MKKILICLWVAAVLLQTGCTKKFDEINTDPTRTSASVFDPNYLLSSAQFSYAAQGYNTFLFESLWIQVLASTSSLQSDYLSNGDKYVASSNTLDYQGRLWNQNYGSSYWYGIGSGSLAYEMQNLTKDKPELSNLYNIGAIMKVLALHEITDVYGDCPYSQALKAKEGITLPVYDKQQDIYNSMLSELDAAVTKLDAAKQGPTADLFYKGDIGKWKRFGYSLMLRIAMRLTKVDPATAQKYAEKAAAGGVFSSVADDAIVKGDNSTGQDNNYASALATDVYQIRWSKTIIDYMVANNDPRLGVVAEIPAAGLTANQDAGTAGNSTPALQKGMPNGYDLKGGATDITKAPNYTGGTGTGSNFTPLGLYSRPTVSMYDNRNGPLFVLSYAEVELMLAEAATRGWNVGSTAALHYAKGVSAGMQSLAAFGSAGAISTTTADAYALAHPLLPANALQQINEQYWLTTGTLFSFVECWANWRRSGYPVLTPVNYIGNFSNGTIPRRQVYPATEGSLNGANYSAAVSRLSGGDTWTSKVWWDK